MPRSARGPRAAAQVVLRVQGAPVPRPARGPQAAARPGRPPRSGRSGTTPVPAPRAAPRVVLPVQGAPAPLPFRRHEPRLRSFLAFTALRCLGPFRVRERPSRSSSPFTALRPRSQFRRHEPRLRSFFAFTALRCLGPFRVRERPSRSSSRVQGAPVPRPLRARERPPSFLPVLGAPAPLPVPAPRAAAQVVPRVQGAPVPRSTRGPRAAAQVVLRVQGAPVPRSFPLQFRARACRATQSAARPRGPLLVRCRGQEIGSVRAVSGLTRGCPSRPPPPAAGCRRRGSKP